MSTPINEIFNEQAIKAQVAAVLVEVSRVSEALKALKAAVDNTKITKSDVQSAKNAAALEAANTKVATAIAKRAQEEEKLAILIAKRAAAEANAARATGQSVNNISEIDRLTRLYEEGLKRLNGTLTTEAEKLAQVKVANAEVNKQLKQQAREMLGLSGAYDKLQAEYQQAKIAAQNLGAQMGVTSKEYLEASAAAMTYNNQLKAIDAGIGNFQRNVGNYASGFVNVNQVLREVPNFAISATTGIQALSNNLPMMVDEIKNFVRQGNGFKDVMAMIGKSIFSLGGAAVLVTTILTALPGILRDMGKEAKQAEEEMRTFFEGVTKEQTSLKILFEVAKDVNQELQVRNQAVKDLRDQYGNYLKNLSDEEILAGKTAGAYTALAEAILKSAKAKAASDQITKLQAENLMDEEKSIKLAAKAEKDAADARLEIARRQGMSLTQRERLAPVSSPTMIFDAAGLEASKIAKSISDRNAQMARLMQTVMQNQVAPFKTDDTKTKKAKVDEPEYFNEVNRLRVLDLERQNVYLKEIRDNEENDYTLRLQAAGKFAQNEQAILDVQVLDEKAKNAFNLKNKKDAKNEEASIEAQYRLDQAKAEVEYRQLLQTMFEKQMKARAEAAKKAEEDDRDAKEKAIAAAEEELQTIVLKNQELENLAMMDAAQRFTDGRIKTYEDYEKEKTKIALKYLKERISAEITATEALLDISGLEKDVRAKYATQLAALKKQLAEAGIKLEAKGVKDAEADDRKRFQNLEKFLRELDQGVRFITQSINEIASIGFANTQARLEEERTAIEKNAALELERINSSTLSERQKADQITILEANKQAQLEANDRKRRKLDQEKARFDRLNSITNIISGTALAVVKALPNVVLAALVGALGAAQLAAAIAAPIPKYKHGTGFHKGGLAVVGDGGKSERVILPSGEQFDTPSTSTLVNLPRGAKVLPDAEMAGRLMIKNMPRKVQAKSNTEDRELMVWQTREITKAMAKNKPKVNTKVNVNLGRDIWLYKQVYE